MKKIFILMAVLCPALAVAQTRPDTTKKEQKALKQVEIKTKRQAIINSNLNPIKTEQITILELSKAACCDLAGCFETQLSVQPQTTNVVSNAKELRILGLSGTYNQVLIDGMPLIQGLSYTYGVSSIPGTLVENIYVSKGANSVLQGFESISGQINVETRKPDHTDRFLFNTYINSFGEKHINANWAFSHNKWSNLLAVHVVSPASRVDGDKDSFLDLPLLNRKMIYNRWKYGRESNWGFHANLTFRYLSEERLGGQKNFTKQTDLSQQDVYGQLIQINQPEWTGKAGFRFNDSHHIVAQVSGFVQNQESYFGSLAYQARQITGYANLQHDFNYGVHQLKSGLSYRSLNLDEDVSFLNTSLARNYAGNYLKKEYITGVFTENTLKFFGDKLTWILGFRADHHNDFGWKFIPRTLLKYDFSENTVIRGNIGKGWRTANIFSENINLLASSRNVIFAEKLLPEEAWNSGLNFTHKINPADDRFGGNISLDFYHTRFTNQIFPDYDTDPQSAIIRNFDGKSISNGFQIETAWQAWEVWSIKAGYSFLDVFQKTGGEKITLPFNPKHKVLSTLSFKPINNSFHIDLNYHWYGAQRLPDTRLNPPAYQRPDFSPTYQVWGMQFTKNFKQLEIYVGAENIFNFRQERPILGYQEPFGQYFDTSFAWGPTRGRELYMGLRYKIAKKV